MLKKFNNNTGGPVGIFKYKDFNDGYELAEFVNDNQVSIHKILVFSNENGTFHGLFYYEQAEALEVPNHTRKTSPIDVSGAKKLVGRK